jgi:hypothetical protein
MATTEQGMSVESFLNALSSLDTNVSHIPHVRTPEQLHVAIPTPKKVTFSTLESPSTPSDQHRPAFNFPSPLHRPSEPTPPRPQQPVVVAPSTPSRILPPSATPATPSSERQSRLAAFSPAPRRPSPTATVPIVASGSSSKMVAAQVQGMGRVALSRQLLVDQLGPATAEQAIAAAAAAEPISSLTFGFGGVVQDSPAFEAFGHPRAVTPTRRRGGGKMGAHVVDERLGKVRSWLESDDEDDEEERVLTWFTIPKGWAADLDQAERDQLVARRLEPEVEIKYVDADDEEESEVVAEVVRVGGKNITTLLKSKKRRVEEDGKGEDKDQEVEVDNDVNAASRASNRKGKGRAAGGVVECVCSRKDEDEPMVQCDDCRAWLHLACLDISSARRLPKQWFCFRCTTDGLAPSPLKRPRTAATTEAPATAPIRPTTPLLSSRQPTLVPTSFSPRPKGSFYRNSLPDMALAPSPKSSPSRRTIPRSPATSTMVPIPVTPQLGQQTRADYSPRSPLFYRSGRVRTVSGAFEDPPANGLQGGWVGNWDGHVFGNANGYEEHHLLAPLDEDDFHPRSWHDMTMTPSRTISSSSLGWAEPGLQTPNTTGRPGAPGRGGHGGAGSGTTTASQDFLSALHDDQDPHHETHQQQRYAVAQRLFASPAHQHQHIVPSSTHQPSLYMPPPSSPLGPKGGRSLHRRASSWIDGSKPFPFPSPSPTPARRLSTTSRDRQSSVTPSQPQASGMTRSGSGLGIGFDGVGLDGRSFRSLAALKRRAVSLTSCFTPDFLPL